MLIKLCHVVPKLQNSRVLKLCRLEFVQFLSLRSDLPYFYLSKNSSSRLQNKLPNVLQSVLTLPLTLLATAILMLLHAHTLKI